MKNKHPHVGRGERNKKVLKIDQHALFKRNFFSSNKPHFRRCLFSFNIIKVNVSRNHNKIKIRYQENYFLKILEFFIFFFRKRNFFGERVIARSIFVLFYIEIPVFSRHCHFRARR